MKLLVVLTILVLVGGWLWFSAFSIVTVHQAFIIYSRITDHVIQVIAGPKAIFVWPWQKVHQIDLTLQNLHLNLAGTATSNLAVDATLDIFYAFDAELLKMSDLDRILPSLHKTGRIVNSWSDYILRSLVAGCATIDLLSDPTCRIRLEKQILLTLQDRIQRFGLRVFTVRLICQPTPEMLQTQLTANRIKLEAQARSQALKQLASALGSRFDLTQILSLDLLQAAQTNETPLLTTFNLPVPDLMSLGRKELNRKSKIEV